MTLTDHTNILDKKIMRNEAQYDFDRKAAKYLHFFLVIWTNMNI